MPQRERIFELYKLSARLFSLIYPSLSSKSRLSIFHYLVFIHDALRFDCLSVRPYYGIGPHLLQDDAQLYFHVF